MSDRVWVVVLVAGVLCCGCRKPPVTLPDAPGAASAETSETSPPRPTPPPPPEPKPDPHLLPDPERSDPEEIRSALERAAGLLSSLGENALDPAETQQKTAAQSFLEQAREALAAEDLTRASVLVEKALILLEDLLPADDE